LSRRKKTKKRFKKILSMSIILNENEEKRTVTKYMYGHSFLIGNAFYTIKHMCFERFLQRRKV
jgi:hypothetical protein